MRDKGKEINLSGLEFAEIGVNGDDEKADGPDFGGYRGLFASFKTLLERVAQKSPTVTLTFVPQRPEQELVLAPTCPRKHCTTRAANRADHK